MTRKPIKTYVIDLFCGAGGTSTAIFRAKTNIEVVACVNHDMNAIISHLKNYPNCLHFTEDIRTLDLTPILKLVRKLRHKDPTCKIALWASLECTNFSKAKNGPKNPDSRTLAQDLFRYLDAIMPDFLWVENVEEFREWGSLDEEGYIIRTKKGEMYHGWVKQLTSDYFSEDYLEDVLVSADYGGRTIRKRLFLQFAKNPDHLATPKQTHCKYGKKGKKWLPVRDILELHDIGDSMFTRKKDFVWKTHRRIYKGLVRFGVTDEKTFGYTYYGQGGAISLTNPINTLTTKDRISLVNAQPYIMDTTYNNIGSSIDSPMHTLTADRHYPYVATPVCLKKNYGTSSASSLDAPCHTITNSPKIDLLSVCSFIHNPQYGGSNRPVNVPAATLIARQDKAPIGLTSAVQNEDIEFELRVVNSRRKKHIEYAEGKIIFNIRPTDDEWLIKIKKYCVKHQIMDVRVRPLNIVEMLRIQGFPDNYCLEGTQTQKKKYIGNSVEVCVGVAMFKAIDKTIQKAA